MAKFLIKANYTAPDGVKGLIADGGTARAEVVKSLLSSLGATVEAYYYAFGDVDVYTIADIPDSATAVALSLAVNASGLATVQMVPLVTAAEVDAGVKKIPSYDAPGPTA
jgi:uncharacterized protein with GYD domain